MNFRAYKFRLWPTAEQAQELERWFAAVRTIYNAALEQRRTYGRRKGSDAFGRDSAFSAPRQTREINFRAKGARAGLKDDPDLGWITSAPREVIDAALRDLDKAFDGFFAGRGDYPSFRTKDRNNSVSLKAWNRKTVGGASVSSPNVIFGQDCVTLPKIGRIRYRRHRKFYGDPKTVEVLREGSEFYIVLVCAQATTALPHPGPAVGIDLGVALPVTLSTGEHILPDLGLKALEERARAEGRKLSRLRRGSRRRERQKRRLAALRRRAARRRAALAHRATTEITRRFGLIALEDLRLRNMTASAAGTAEEPGRNVRAKAGLNRAILNVAPATIRAQIDYKAARTGALVVAVDPKNTSRTCPACGHVAAENRVSQARFECACCGYTEHADLNAARTILARAQASAGAAARRKTSSESGHGSAASKASGSCFQPASSLKIDGNSSTCAGSGAASAELGADCSSDHLLPQFVAGAASAELGADCSKHRCVVDFGPGAASAELGADCSERD